MDVRFLALSLYIMSHRATARRFPSPTTKYTNIHRALNSIRAAPSTHYRLASVVSWTEHFKHASAENVSDSARALDVFSSEDDWHHITQQARTRIFAQTWIGVRIHERSHGAVSRDDGARDVRRDTVDFF